MSRFVEGVHIGRIDLRFEELIGLQKFRGEDVASDLARRPTAVLQLSVVWPAAMSRASWATSSADH